MKRTEEHIRTVTTKGQVTIPIEVRRLLGVKPQDKVVFEVKDGKVALRPVTMTLRDTFGSVTPRKQPEDFDELREIVIEERVQQIMADMQDQI